MSITQGMTGGGSWSGSHTLRAFPRGAGYHTLGRGTMALPSWMLPLLVGLAVTPVVVVVARSLWFARAVKVVTNPIFWGTVNVYEESKDIASYLRGEDMSWQLTYKWRPVFGPHPAFGPVVFPLPFPYLDFTKSPSSGGGGPGGIPNLHRPPPSIEETGEILSNPTMAGEVPSSPKRRKSCPPGYRWSKRLDRCVKYNPNSFTRKNWRR